MVEVTPTRPKYHPEFLLSASLVIVSLRGSQWLLEMIYKNQDLARILDLVASAIILHLL